MGGNSRTRNGTGSTTDIGDETEKLIQKVCSSFCSQIKTEFNQRFDKIDSNLRELSNSIKGLRVDISTNTASISKLNIKTDMLDQSAKRNTLRIHGLQEQQDENTIEEAIAFIKNILKIECSAEDIDYAFRVGELLHDKPRVVIVNFINNWKRNEIFNAKKVLKSTKYAMFEDLTKDRYKLLLDAKNKYGTKNVWSAGGKIYRWDGETKHKV